MLEISNDGVETMIGVGGVSEGNGLIKVLSLKSLHPSYTHYHDVIFVTVGYSF